MVSHSLVVNHNYTTNFISFLLMLIFCTLLGFGGDHFAEILMLYLEVSVGSTFNPLATPMARIFRFFTTDACHKLLLILR